MRLRFQLLFTLTLFFLTFQLSAQNASTVLDDFSHGLLKGGYDEIVPLLASQVEIGDGAGESTHQATKARSFLANFMDEYPCTSFSLLHTGESNQMVYAMAEYRSDKESFEVNLYLRKEKNTYRIERFLLDKL